MGGRTSDSSSSKKPASCCSCSDRYRLTDSDVSRGLKATPAPVASWLDSALALILSFKPDRHARSHQMSVIDVRVSEHASAQLARAATTTAVLYTLRHTEGLKSHVHQQPPPL